MRFLCALAIVACLLFVASVVYTAAFFMQPGPDSTTHTGTTVVAP